MEKNPKISIITCFLNVELFIRESIESVLQQEYKNWELLLIDDGSSDESTAIAKMFAEAYKENIFFYEHQGHINKGLSSSRNVGMRKSTGEYIAFLDADDVLLPKYLSSQVSLLQAHDAVMICEATEYWYSWNDFNAADDIIKIGTDQDTLYNPPELMVNLYPLGLGAAPCVCGILIKKTTLEKYGGFDEAFTGMYEDQVFLSKIYLNEKIFISSSCNNRYRQRHDSLVGSSYKSGDYYVIRRRYLDWLKKYLEVNNIHYPQVTLLLEKALHQPLVSVIVCFYNEERFLKETIESVLSQDYKNFELLLVDDGSFDKSTEIALKYASDFPGNIFYLQHENHSNKGLSASRNTGIKQAKGEFIAFLDADDIWLPGKLLSQVSIFQRNPEVGMIIEGSVYWKEWDNSGKKNANVFIGAASETVYNPPQLIFNLYPIGSGAAPVPSGLIIKKESIQRSGSFEEGFIKKYSLYEDQAFLAKIYLQEKIYVSSECNNLYRQRTGSIVESVKANGDYHIVRRYFLEWLKNYLNTYKIQNLELNKLLEKALEPYHHPVKHFFKDTIRKEAVRVTKRIIPNNIKEIIKQNLHPVK